MLYLLYRNTTAYPALTKFLCKKQTLDQKNKTITEKKERKTETYSVEAAPLFPELKLSMYLTHRCSSGTVVPPDVTHTILLPPPEELCSMKPLSFWSISSIFLRGGDDSKKELTSSSSPIELISQLFSKKTKVLNQSVLKREDKKIQPKPEPICFYQISSHQQQTYIDH